MAEMNLSTEQKQAHRHREQSGGGHVGRMGQSLGLAEASCYTEKGGQHSPTVEHRELYSMFHDKP